MNTKKFSHGRHMRVWFLGQGRAAERARARGEGKGNKCRLGRVRELGT